MGRTGATGLGDGSRGRLDLEGRAGGRVVCTIIRYMYLCSKVSGGLRLVFLRLGMGWGVFCCKLGGI